MEAVLSILRGETLLFRNVLPNSTPQAEKAFCNVCSCIIEELCRIIEPFVGENSVDNLTGSGSKNNGGSHSTGLMVAASFNLKKSDKSTDTKPIVLQRKSNLFLIHLDILDTFLANFYDLRYSMLVCVII